MKINLDNLQDLVTQETLRVIRETLEPHLGDGTEERDRQDKMAKAVQKRGLHAADEKDETNEAEEDVEVEETEVEEEETGVPETIDKEEGEATAPREDRTGGKGTKDSPKLDTPSMQQLEKPTVGAVIDKLNALRGGRSLKDPEVKKSFSQYFESLTSNERETMLVFLTGLAQILAGTASGADALDPGDVGLRVKDEPGDEAVVRKKVSKEKAEEKEAGREDRPGSKEQPIVVGEQQYKSHVRKIFEAYRSQK